MIGTVVHVGLYWEIQRRGLRAGRAMPWWRSRWSPEDAKEVLRVGSPSGFHWLLDVGAWTLFTVAVARLDPVQSAANIIGITLIRVSFMPGYGISTAAQTLVGQYLGARDQRQGAPGLSHRPPITRDEAHSKMLDLHAEPELYDRPGTILKL